MHPLDSMECPGCGATLPQTATGCSCGYRFVTGAPAGPTFMSVPDTTPVSDGTFIGGLLLGFFCGCIGLAIAYIANTGPQTKQGALVGFGVGFVVGALVRILAYADR